MPFLQFRSLSLAFCAALAGCAPSGAERSAAVGFGPGTGAPAAPADAPPGTCWGRTVSPAVVETVTEQHLERPAQVTRNGNVVAPPRYRTQTRQRIVTPRRATWFETPCPAEITPDVVASLQRALMVRGLYGGQITGRMDAATRRAVRAYQQAEGLDSDELSLETARSLGLIVAERDPA